MTDKGKWHIRGHDTFSDEPYSIPGDYETEDLAKEAARDMLEELEKTQPSKSSGGQDGEGAIQDHVYITRPDGSEYRFRG